MNLSFRMFLEEFKVLSPYDENNELILYKGSNDEKNDSDEPKSIINNFKYFLDKLEDDRSIDVLKKDQVYF